MGALRAVKRGSGPGTVIKRDVSETGHNFMLSGLVGEASKF